MIIAQMSIPPPNDAIDAVTRTTNRLSTAIATALSTINTISYTKLSLPLLYHYYYYYYYHQWLLITLLTGTLTAILYSELVVLYSIL